MSQLEVPLFAKAKIMEIITRTHDCVRKNPQKHIMERRVYVGPRPSDYFHNFGLWEAKIGLIVKI